MKPATPKAFVSNARLSEPANRFSLATLLATVRTVLDEPRKRAPGKQVWDDDIRKAQG